MIYNLVNYVKTQLPLLNFVCNGWGLNAPVECINIKDSGGSPTHWYPRNDYTVQVLSRATNSFDAKQNIDQVYDLLQDRFHLLLPQVIIKLIVFEEVQTYQISPIQMPGYVGADENNLEMWSFNLIITTA